MFSCIIFGFFWKIQPQLELASIDKVENLLSLYEIFSMLESINSDSFFLMDILFTTEPLLSFLNISLSTSLDLRLKVNAIDMATTTIIDIVRALVIFLNIKYAEKDMSKFNIDGIAATSSRNTTNKSNRNSANIPSMYGSFITPSSAADFKL
ncbi:hypothetical protein GCM10011613_33150 [Cellvibrio zantedeschiae]|uniref:Uncharacterized protein n=1 Tax=Cellvibrio zantedeschiae TaxID=1237077 RepID=A0ABQ3B9C5_9GAMM|nr:hypothetical protein GCM10011613_33150 [Cellvibrio zantedeschiae]